MVRSADTVVNNGTMLPVLHQWVLLVQPFHLPFWYFFDGIITFLVSWVVLQVLIIVLGATTSTNKYNNSSSSAGSMLDHYWDSFSYSMKDHDVQNHQQTIVLIVVLLPILVWCPCHSYCTIRTTNWRTRDSTTSSRVACHVPQSVVPLKN